MEERPNFPRREMEMEIREGSARLSPADPGAFFRLLTAPRSASGRRTSSPLGQRLSARKGNPGSPRRLLKAQKQSEERKEIALESRGEFWKLLCCTHCASCAVSIFLRVQNQHRTGCLSPQGQRGPAGGQSERSRGFGGPSGTHAGPLSPLLPLWVIYLLFSPTMTTWTDAKEENQGNDENRVYSDGRGGCAAAVGGCGCRGAPGRRASAPRSRLS